jgi:pimeloyl-ACP methyl ester carboxylesterase
VEEAFFFTHDDRRLFAVAHAPADGASNVGVVVCHPFAEERQFADRVLVRFARALACAGVAVLRFDQPGHGDSEGDLVGASVTGHIAAIQAATAQLLERHRVEAVVLLGLRLGASLAALAAERDPRVAGLVLWSPILAGRAYVRDLLRKRIAMQVSASGDTPTVDGLLETLHRDGRLELDGDLVGRTMFDDLIGLDLALKAETFRGPVLLTTLRTRREQYPGHDALLEVYRGRGADATFVTGEPVEYWDVRSMFDGVVPDDVFAVTLAWLGARWRVAA